MDIEQAEADAKAVKADAVSDFEKIKAAIEREGISLEGYVKTHVVYFIAAVGLVVGFLAGHFIR